MDETKTDGPLVVGVTKRNDGTLDFSQAAIMRPGTVEYHNPVVDRLQGPLLVDRAREAAYRKQVAEVGKIDEEGRLKEWFANLVNNLNYRDDGQSPGVTEEDLSSLEFIIDSEEVQALQTTFRGDYVRPFFRVNLADYRKVYEKITGRSGSNGCIISGGELERNELTRDIGIIFAPQLGPELIHELLHSLDPYRGQRTAGEAVLEEFAAHYYETFVPAIVIQTINRGDGSDRPKSEVIRRKRFETLAGIKRILRDGIYLNRYGNSFDKPESYYAKVDAIAETILELEQHMSKPDVNKAILNAKSHSELIHLLDVVARKS